jgi:hypothetical protein
MQHQTKEITETRLHGWKLFFESEQSEANGNGELRAGDDPRLVATGADYETHGVDAVVCNAMQAAIETGDVALFDMAELVNMLADNYVARLNSKVADTLMRDDAVEPPIRYDHVQGVTLAELDAALAGV